jgi:hypothetical protein
MLESIRRVFEWILIRFSRNTHIDGLWVGAFEGKRDAELSEKVGQALRLIKAYDPRRYARVLKGLDRVLVGLIPGNIAQFRTDTRTCEIDARFVFSYSPEKLATVIVHESTHGKLRQLNIGYSEAMRDRVEKVCVRQEFAFASKLPNAEEMRKALESERLRPATEWTDEAFRKRHREGKIGLFRHVGLPAWLIKTMMGSSRQKNSDRRNTPD